MVSASVSGARSGYCPSCFALIEVHNRHCPACGLDVSSLSARDYRDKLLAALEHPLADVRLRAIIALGWRGEGDASPALAQCALRHPLDVVEGLQVVASLAGLQDAATREPALRRLAVEHPSRMVRSAAEQCLGEEVLTGRMP